MRDQNFMMNAEFWLNKEDIIAILPISDLINHYHPQSLEDEPDIPFQFFQKVVENRSASDNLVYIDP